MVVLAAAGMAILILPFNTIDMKRLLQQLFLPFLLLTVLAGCVKDRVTEASVIVPSDPVDPGDRELIHYWSFNSGSLLSPAFTIGNGLIVTGDTYDDTEGTKLNSRNGSDSGKALRIRNPSSYMVIKAPTRGYKSPLLTFAVMRTSNGAQENIIEYTTDGISFTSEGIAGRIVNVTTEWIIYSIDFAAVAAASDNPDFAIRFTFNVGNTNVSGNNRYDNIAVDALKIDSIPEEPVDTLTANDTLIHYWNFNGTAVMEPFYTSGGAAMSYTAAFDPVNEGTVLNARNNDLAGNALRLRNPASDFFVKVPTTGFKQVKVKYAVMRTGNGARMNNIYYTLDGRTYISSGLENSSYAVTEGFVLQEFDFSSITGADNNPEFGIKIVFGDGEDNTSGNNRYDNWTVEGRRL